MANGKDKTFKLKVKSNILHDGKEYVAGDTIELTQEQAEAMPHAVEFEVPFKLKDKKQEDPEGDKK